MRILSVRIKNFKSIRFMEINHIEQALILVGKNNTGKTSVVDAIRAAFGIYPISEADFNERKQRVEIGISLQISEEDLHQLHQLGRVSMYKRYEVWKRIFAASCLRSGKGCCLLPVSLTGKGLFAIMMGLRRITGGF